METEKLIRDLAERGLVVNRELIEKIVEREDTPKLLLEMMDDLAEVSDWWLPVHAMFILTIIKNRESLEALKQLVKKYDLGDWVTEELQYLLAYFGPEYFDDIAEIVRDREQNVFVRGAAYEALVRVSKDNQKAMEKLIAISKEILEEGDIEFLSVVALDMARIPNEEIYSALTAFVKEHEKKFKQFFTLQDLRELHEEGIPDDSRDPWEHFHPRNLLSLYKMHYGTLKIGRNDPCICGSGKKFKKCCWKYWIEVR